MTKRCAHWLVLGLIPLAGVVFACSDDGGDGDQTAGEETDTASDAGDDGSGGDEAADATSTGQCTLEDNVEAWGTNGNSGWARDWVLAQCGVQLDGSVITYVNLPGTCGDGTRTQQSCPQHLLAACGGAEVSLCGLEPEECTTPCRGCKTLCADAGAHCTQAATCSNNPLQRCNNDPQCIYSVAPYSGPCATGSAKIANWSDFYNYKNSAGTASAVAPNVFLHLERMNSDTAPRGALHKHRPRAPCDLRCGERAGSRGLKSS